MKKKIRKKIIIVLILIIFLILMSNLYKSIEISKYKNKAEKMETEEITFDLYSYENEKMIFLITATDYQSGIKQIEYEKESQKKTINTYLKTKVSFDYEIENEGEYKFTIINGNDEKIEKTLIIDNEYKNSIISIQESNSEISETEKSISIDFKDYENNTYKIGTRSKDWIKYEGPFVVNSYSILENKLGDEDKTLSIYAKSEDKAHNKVIISKKILSLDIDIANEPVINVTNVDEYARIESGIYKVNSLIDITYDSRNDITNLYSVNNGITWNEYTGPFESQAIKILAKSVKNNSGLLISSQKWVNPSASNAITINAYDSNLATNFTTDEMKYISVDSNMIGEKLIFNLLRGNSGFNQYIYFEDSEGNQIEGYTLTSGGKYEYIIPENTVRIGYKGSTASYSQGWAGSATFYARLVEIDIETESKINVEKKYPKLDIGNIVSKPYYNIEIDYNKWSTKQLYKIDDGEWIEYTDKFVVEVGHVVYAKGIDENGEDLDIVSVNCDGKDFLSEEAYDNDENTYITTDETDYIETSDLLIGKTISFTILRGNAGIDQYIFFEDNKGNVIENYTITSGGTYKYIIPENTTKIGYKGSTASYSQGWAGSAKFYARLVEIKILD